METLESILTRRSIRKYSSQPVPDEVVEQLLRAAMAAPSASNEQPWQFVVIRDHSVLNQIPGFHPHSHMLRQAALAILVCDDPLLEVSPGRGHLDCSNATQNMLLAAHSLGLGAVWLGIYPVPERMDGMRELLGIPPHIVPVSLVSIGYPDEKLRREDRFKPERVHNERWTGTQAYEIGQQTTPAMEQPTGKRPSGPTHKRYSVAGNIIRALDHICHSNRKPVVQHRHPDCFIGADNRVPVDIQPAGVDGNSKPDFLCRSRPVHLSFAGACIPEMGFSHRYSCDGRHVALFAGATIQTLFQH